MSHSESVKPMVNLVVGKALSDLYFILVKPVEGKDVFDLLLPFQTLFIRRVLIEHLFSIVMACFVLHFAVINRKPKVAKVDLSELKARAKELGPAAEHNVSELLKLARKVGIEDSEHTAPTSK
jgi:hypothetical protein